LPVGASGGGHGRRDEENGEVNEALQGACVT